METQNTDERVESLLREANIHRLRGQFQEAEQRCRAVLELAPAEVGALELLGDLLRERGRLEEAAEQYRQAAAASPDRPSPERKYAEVTLELADRLRLRDAATRLLESPSSTQQHRRNFTAAFLLSCLFPGLGQFYNHEPVKGTLLVIGGLILLGCGGDALLRLMFTVATARASGSISPMGAWMGFLGLVIWLYAVVDAAMTARSHGAGPAG